MNGNRENEEILCSKGSYGRGVAIEKLFVCGKNLVSVFIYLIFVKLLNFQI